MALQADLAGLRTWLGVKSTDADANLQQALDAAVAWVNSRVYPVDQDPATRHIDVTQAILILAARVYARRNSPEGVAGWGDLGVVNIATSDPDINRLLERHVDMSEVGLA
jgi:Phage gp6-like head-tail connector protein